MDAERDQHQPSRIDPVEIVEAVKRGSIYLGYWVCVVGLAVTASPHGLAHWTFWVITLLGVVGAGCWALRGPAAPPLEEGYSAGAPQFGPRGTVDTSSYRPSHQPPAVSGGATRYLSRGDDPPHLMK